MASITRFTHFENIDGKAIDHCTADAGVLEIIFEDGSRLSLGLEGPTARHWITHTHPLLCDGVKLRDLRFCEWAHTPLGEHGSIDMVQVDMVADERTVRLMLHRRSSATHVTPLTLRYRLTLTGSQEIREGEL